MKSSKNDFRKLMVDLSSVILGWILFCCLTEGGMRFVGASNRVGRLCSDPKKPVPVVLPRAGGMRFMRGGIQIDNDFDGVPDTNAFCFKELDNDLKPGDTVKIRSPFLAGPFRMFCTTVEKVR